jgi:branched-chain amino acid transport system ATP-binding protein
LDRQAQGREGGGVAVSALLSIRQASIAFGGLKAVQDFNVELPQGALYGLIGPNGAGKTTVFNVLTGVYRPDTGTIRLDGRDLIGLKPHQIAASGMSRTFQNIRLFPHLSVLDNVRIACHLRGRHALVPTILRFPKQQAEERSIVEKSRRLLSLFELDDRRDEEARSLPYGDQRRLEIARALATEPKVVLLDEPAAGMNPKETHALATLIRRLRDEFKMTILLIEHDMALVMEICDRITVLDYGVTIASGDPDEIQKNPKVIEAYLGEPMDAAT